MTTIYKVSETAFEPFKKYIVFVTNRGWTDGLFRTDYPSGWCHKWASDFGIFGKENRGVTHFMELPNDPV